MFQQFEALVVGEGITLADLKGTLHTLVRGMFGDAVEEIETGGVECIQHLKRSFASGGTGAHGGQNVKAFAAIGKR